MNQQKLKMKPQLQGSKALFGLAACFLVGGFLGTVLAARIGDADNALALYLTSYLEAAQTGVADAPEVLSVVWDVLRYPLACFCLCFFPLGRILIPIISGVRGFFLAFSIASFVRIFGGAGLLLSAGVFLPTALIVIPCMLFWGLVSLRESGKGASPLRMLPACGVCAGVLLLAVLYECCWGSEVLGWLAHAVV